MTWASFDPRVLSRYETCAPKCVQLLGQGRVADVLARCLFQEIELRLRRQDIHGDAVLNGLYLIYALVIEIIADKVYADEYDGGDDESGQVFCGMRTWNYLSI